MSPSFRYSGALDEVRYRVHRFIPRAGALVWMESPASRTFTEIFGAHGVDCRYVVVTPDQWPEQVWLVDLDDVIVRSTPPHVVPNLYHVFESVESAVMAGHLGSYDTYRL
jgi:hypothetical protein